MSHSSIILSSLTTKNSFIKPKSWSTFAAGAADAGRMSAWVRGSHHQRLSRGNECSHPLAWRLMASRGYANLILIYSISIGHHWPRITRTCSSACHSCTGHTKEMQKFKCLAMMSIGLFYCLPVELNNIGESYRLLKKTWKDINIKTNFPDCNHIQNRLLGTVQY